MISSVLSRVRGTRREVIAMFCCGITGCAVHASAGCSYREWKEHRETLLKNPSLIRYYTFEEFRDPGTPVRNLAGEAGTLRLGVVAGPPEESFKIVPGRFAEKKAVQLDQGYFHTEPFDVGNKSFAVEIWCRIHGLGTQRGDAVPSGGTILSAGVGYWDGWRITMLYPDKTLGLEIGRPAPVNAVSIRTAPIADNVWHHIAGTWDGQRMCLYVDGILAASRPYAGDYYPPKPGAQFRVGFAGYGWGAVVMDVDEVAVYNRSLAPVEILRNACFYAEISETVARRLEVADASFDGHNWNSATNHYTAILNQKDLHPEIHAIARLRLAAIYREQRKTTTAFAEYAKVLGNPAVSEGIRGLALTSFLQLARQGVGTVPRDVGEAILRIDGLSPRDRIDVHLTLVRGYCAEKDFPAARDQCRKVLEIAGLTSQDKLELRLKMGHIAYAAGDYKGARSEYAAIAATSDAPAYYRSYAQLLIGDTFVREKSFASAKLQFARIQTMPEAPDSHKWEATERLNEIERMRAGLAPRDPLASRTRIVESKDPAVKLYIAPDGSDANPGTQTAPLTTLEGAREAIRSLKHNGTLPRGGVVVIVKPGEYRRDATFRLTAEDSGTEDAPVVYRAERQGTARFTGGVRISGFAPVQEAEVMARLPEDARGKVVQVDLKGRGITDFGELQPRGFGWQPSPVLELFFDGRPMQLARWPNEGYVRTGKVIDPRSAFTYDGDRPSRWQNARDPWVFGFWRFLWADGRMGIAAIDADTRQIRTGHVYTYGGGIAEGMPYYYYNILDEIDQPGEWYLDRATGILYLYPPSDPEKALVELSMLSSPMVEMDRASHVAMRGLLFELGRSDGIIIRGGTRCLLAGCMLRKLGGTGVQIVGGRSHGVLSCDIHTTGRNGTWVAGGDRKTLTPGGHFVENCHIYDFSRIDRTYTPAVWMEGVGNRIAHNLFHDSPGHAIRLEGNDHIVEFNEIHSVLKESDDQGGLDMWFNPTYRGNILRYNFWHNIGSGNVPCGQAGVRLDDAISGVVIYGNIFWKCSHAHFGGLQIHGGKENIIENNIFADCRCAISFSGWGEARWRQFLESDAVKKALTQDGDITQPPYSTRYPTLAHLAKKEGVNMVWRNLIYSCGEFLLRDRGIQELMDNRITSDDPGFADAAKGNFSLKQKTATTNLVGFRSIPFEEIGLYQDNLRASSPTSSARWACATLPHGRRSRGCFTTVTISPFPSFAK